MCIAAQEELENLRELELLPFLLADRTAGRNIIWATDAHVALGGEYGRYCEITQDLLFRPPFRLMSRAEKARQAQSERTKSHAEVFTPLWVVEKMCDCMDAEWFGHESVFGADHVSFAQENDWRDYVDSRRLEIACGEAPYLASRYDVSSGDSIPLPRRVGILDRKLRVVTENTDCENEWLKWAIRALKATYGFEFQGDNVLLARLNVLLDFCEQMQAACGRWPSFVEQKYILEIIAWNIWQMDGLSATIPYCRPRAEVIQFNLFGQQDNRNEQPPCLIYDWQTGQMEYRSLKVENGSMKFDFIIGNPPYQDETVGEQKTFAPPIYNLFMDEAYKISDRVLLITPARFLFNAGNTPKEWNRKMLGDSHFKVLLYEADAAKVFPNTSINGGVVISYHDKSKDFGTIGTFTPFEELNSILLKVNNNENFVSMSSLVITRTVYRLTNKMHAEHPEAKGELSEGHAYDMASNIFERLPQIFYDVMPVDGHEYIKILGRKDGSRTYKYIRADYVNSVKNLRKYKVIVSGADGAAGTVGRPIPARIVGVPSIEEPGTGTTESFISIGCFDDRKSAQNALAYIKTKFARVLLGVKKVTQAITPEKWEYVPLQNFTPPHSDIDWSKSIPEIDQQLYRKYGLDQAEIDFIESHVKEMV